MPRPPEFNGVPPEVALEALRTAAEGLPIPREYWWAVYRLACTVAARLGPRLGLDGYEPRWDLSPAKAAGRQGELFMRDIRIGIADGSVETKRDTKVNGTGKLFVEFQQAGPDGRWRSSGIAVSQAELWAFVLATDSEDLFALVVPRLHVVQHARWEWRQGNWVERDGRNPTRGVLVDLHDFVSWLLRHA